MILHRGWSVGSGKLPVLLAACLAACGEGPAAGPAGNQLAEPDIVGDAPAPADKNAKRDWPAIHLDQTQELVIEGENAARRDYRVALDQCRKTGWPIRELSDAELERLGTTRVRMWLSPRLEVLRDEQWKLGLQAGAAVDSCLFRLEYSGRYSYADGSTELSRELGDGAITGDHTAPVVGGEIPPRFALDPATGTPGGFRSMGTRQVTGQVCRAWRGRSLNGQIEQCIWSGGRAFGFDDHNAGEGCSPARPIEAGLDAIVLSQEPVGGKGCRIRTSAFTVGAALDSEAYAAPVAGGDARSRAAALRRSGGPHAVRRTACRSGSR